jgi:hypothetical protein
MKLESFTKSTHWSSRGGVDLSGGSNWLLLGCIVDDAFATMFIAVYLVPSVFLLGNGWGFSWKERKDILWSRCAWILIAVDLTYLRYCTKNPFLSKEDVRSRASILWSIRADFDIQIKCTFRDCCTFLLNAARSVILPPARFFSTWFTRWNWIDRVHWRYPNISKFRWCLLRQEFHRRAKSLNVALICSARLRSRV